MQIQPRNLPPLPQVDDIYELLTVTAELRDVLLRESEHLKKMEMKEVSKLADEKLRLTQKLEGYQRLIQARPELVRMLDEGSRQELAELTEEFSQALAENMRRTAVARAVNQRVVSAIMDVVSESQHAGTYNKYGSNAVPSNLAISFNLNQQA